MLKGLVKKFKSAVDDTEEIEKEIFAQVMKEIDDGFQDKGLLGKAKAKAGGDDNKSESIYIQIRAEELQKSIQEKRQIQGHLQQIEARKIRKKHDNKIARGFLIFNLSLIVLAIVIVLIISSRLF